MCQYRWGLYSIALDMHSTDSSLMMGLTPLSYLLQFTSTCLTVASLFECVHSPAWCKGKVKALWRLILLTPTDEIKLKKTSVVLASWFPLKMWWLQIKSGKSLTSLVSAHLSMEYGSSVWSEMELMKLLKAHPLGLREYMMNLKNRLHLSLCILFSNVPCWSCNLAILP